MFQEEINIEDLIPAPYNPKKVFTNKIEDLKASILEFGYIDYLIVNKNTMHVIGGNQRLTALKELGFKQIIVNFVELSLAKEKVLNLRLNKQASEMDNEKVFKMLQEIESLNLDFSLTGFEISEIDNLYKMFEVSENFSDKLWQEEEVVQFPKFSNKKQQKLNERKEIIEAKETLFYEHKPEENVNSNSLKLPDYRTLDKVVESDYLILNFKSKEDLEDFKLKFKIPIKTTSIKWEQIESILLKEGLF